MTIDTLSFSGIGLNRDRLADAPRNAAVGGGVVGVGAGVTWVGAHRFGADWPRSVSAASTMGRSAVSGAVVAGALTALNAVETPGDRAAAALVGAGTVGAAAGLAVPVLTGVWDPTRLRSGSAISQVAMVAAGVGMLAGGALGALGYNQGS